MTWIRAFWICLQHSWAKINMKAQGGDEWRSCLILSSGVGGCVLRSITHRRYLKCLFYITWNGSTLNCVAGSGNQKNCNWWWSSGRLEIESDGPLWLKPCKDEIWLHIFRLTFFNERLRKKDGVEIVAIGLSELFRGIWPGDAWEYFLKRESFPLKTWLNVWYHLWVWWIMSWVIGWWLML